VKQNQSPGTGILSSAVDSRAHPERLAALAAEFGSEILGHYPNP